MPDGTSAIIPAKINNDAPWPTPRAVICSANHITNTVPPTSATNAVNSNDQPGFTTAGTPFTGAIDSNPRITAQPCTIAKTTAKYRVYWLILIRPDSPSLRKSVSDLLVAVNNCNTIDAEMYGKMFNAKTDIRDKEPPANISNMPSIPLPSPVNKCNTADALTPGNGIKEPIR